MTGVPFEQVRLEPVVLVLEGGERVVLSIAEAVMLAHLLGSPLGPREGREGATSWVGR